MTLGSPTNTLTVAPGELKTSAIWARGTGVVASKTGAVAMGMNTQANGENAVAM